MGISQSHIRLVDELKYYVNVEHGKTGNCIIYLDNPNTPNWQKIPKIGDTIPDLYARCFNPDLIILGEAKTINDVENPHSIFQYKHYLLFCNQNKNTHLIFAVPWTAVSCLRNTIRNLTRRLNIKNVHIVYLERLPE